MGLRYRVCSTFTTVAFDFPPPAARNYWRQGIMHKILVVDDTEDARDVLARLLRLGGFCAVTAEDGIEALKRLELDHPDLVLLDLMMPRMNGVELLEMMRQDPRWKKGPVMLLTAVSD